MQPPSPSDRADSDRTDLCGLPPSADEATADVPLGADAPPGPNAPLGPSAPLATGDGGSESRREPSETLAYARRVGAADGADDKAATVIRRSDGGSSVRHTPVRGAATPAEVARVLLGSHLSHFWLEELIGGGGMGAVFRARDERLDRTVAIKVIPFIGDDPDMLRRFRNEAQSAARLDHPNIARVFDVGMFDGWRYIVFEYIEGTNLRDLIAREGVLSIDDAVFFTRQIAEALHHASGRGVVHRDVKPSNVLVNTEGETKLVDMGLARSDQLEMSGDMTASGVTLGTFDYISPEQAKDPRDADVRSDIYSLGCTLYFMLTGSPPYPGGTMLQKLLNHGNSPPPDPSELRAGISDDLKAIIQKMLAKSPSDRYQRAIDLVADLQQLAAREGLERAQSQGTVTINHDDGRLRNLLRHLPWVAAAALLALGGGGLQLLASLRSSTFVLEPPVGAAPLRPVAAASENSLVTPAPGSAAATAVATSADPVSGSGPSGAAAAVTEPNAGGLDAAGPPPDSAVGAISDAGLARSNSSSDPVPGPRPRPANGGDRGEQPPSEGGVGVSGPVVASGPVAATSEPVDIASLPPRYTGLAGAMPAAGASGGTAAAGDLAPVVKVEKIVVGGAVAPSPAVHPASSLQEALSVAHELDVKTIELATGQLVSAPLHIPMDGLTIRSAVGFTEIRFQNDNSAALQRPAMIQLGTHRIDFQGIHFHWAVDRASIDGGSLFAVAENRLVRLTDCTLTLENRSQRDNVYAFEINASRPEQPRGLFPLDPLSLREGDDTASFTAGGSDPDAAVRSQSPPVQPNRPLSPPLVAIELDNVAARGEMTLVRLLEPAQLQLRWDNGLLACTGHLLQTHGAADPLTGTNHQVQLSFNRVTCWTQQALISTRLSPQTPYPLAVDRDSRNGVFRAGITVAHVQFSGLDFTQPASGWETIDRGIQLRGEDNVYDTDYDGDRPLLVAASDNGQRQVFWMSQMRDGDRPNWLSERSTRWGVRWSQPFDSSVPASQMSVAQFYQDGTVVSGFDRSRLPVFPTESPAVTSPPRNYPAETDFESEAEAGSPM